MKLAKPPKPLKNVLDFSEIEKGKEIIVFNRLEKSVLVAVVKTVSKDVISCWVVTSVTSQILDFNRITGKCNRSSVPLRLVNIAFSECEKFVAGLSAKIRLAEQGFADHSLMAL